MKQVLLAFLAAVVTENPVRVNFVMDRAKRSLVVRPS
jgi:hypothetical protein